MYICIFLILKETPKWVYTRLTVSFANGQARLAYKKMEIPSQVVTSSRLYFNVFSTSLEHVRLPFTMKVQNGLLHDMTCVVKRGAIPK